MAARSCWLLSDWLPRSQRASQHRNCPYVHISILNPAINTRSSAHYLKHPLQRPSCRDDHITVLADTHSSSQTSNLLLLNASDNQFRHYLLATSTETNCEQVYSTSASQLGRNLHQVVSLSLSTLSEVFLHFATFKYAVTLRGHSEVFLK